MSHIKQRPATGQTVDRAGNFSTADTVEFTCIINGKQEPHLSGCRYFPILSRHWPDFLEASR